MSNADVRYGSKLKANHVKPGPEKIVLYSKTLFVEVQRLEVYRHDKGLT